LVIAEPFAAPAVNATERDPEPETMLVIEGAAGGCATSTVDIVGAVKLSVAALVARSAIAPPFSEILVPSAMPSVSISKSLVCTV
jgi:hypothetical protein